MCYLTEDVYRQEMGICLSKNWGHYTATGNKAQNTTIVWMNTHFCTRLNCRIISCFLDTITSACRHVRPCGMFVSHSTNGLATLRQSYSCFYAQWYCRWVAATVSEQHWITATLQLHFSIIIIITLLFFSLLHVCHSWLLFLT